MKAISENCNRVTSCPIFGCLKACGALFKRSSPLRPTEHGRDDRPRERSVYAGGLTVAVPSPEQPEKAQTFRD